MKQTHEDISRANGGQLRMSKTNARGLSRFMLDSLRDWGA